MKFRKKVVVLIFTVFFISVIHGQGDISKGTVSLKSNVQKLAGGFKFTEGPAADKEGNVYFTDIPNSRIHKWSVDGKLSTFVEKTGGANGLFFDKKGNLLACAGGSGKLVSISPAGEITVLAGSYEGKLFNSPNDLWIDPKGGVYFTDPRYGSRENLPQGGEHVYYLSADRKKVVRVVDDMVRPNGVLGTPDGKLLYVADHGAGKTYTYKIKADGSLSGKKLFAGQGSDGMVLDGNGNVYLTGEAVTVYDRSGKLIEMIEVPERPSNVCFGGKGKRTLFITAEKSLYCVDLQSKFYSFTMKDIDGKAVSLSQYQGKVVLVVNVASKCGFTKQYAGLQQLYDEYKGQGFVVLGFPTNSFGGQEPGINSEIKSFCTKSFDVTFPMFSKIAAIGKDIDPLYQYLTSPEENGGFGKPITWNFNKILIGKDGETIALFPSKVDPLDLQIIDAVSEAIGGKRHSALSELDALLAREASSDLVAEVRCFGDVELSKLQADKACLLVRDSVAIGLRKDRDSEWQDKEIRIGDKVMRFDYRLFGPVPATGRSLYISMHGGGGTTSAVNDSQWRNQIGLYKTPAGSIYLAPRAPTDSWNLWHQGHIDKFFDRIITDAILFADVNPDKVYLLGYSAGGDGVYQLAPRMADRFAAASMMAGHPNEASPLGLRNIGFMIWVGQNDGAYGRNRIAGEWGAKLGGLAKADPKGYEHEVHVVAGKGHWMDREDGAAIEWLAKFERDQFPKKVVWKQDDVLHQRFYWLAVDAGEAKAGAEVVAVVDGQTIRIEKSNDVKKLTIRLSDEMLDLDEPVAVVWGGDSVYDGTPKRSIATILKSVEERSGAGTIFCSEITVVLNN